MTTSRNGPLLAALLAFAFAVRLAGFAWAYSKNPDCILEPDSPTYEKPSLALLHAGAFASDPATPGTPEVMRTPGYPAFIAAIYAVFGERRGALIFFQILLSVASVGLLYFVVVAAWGTRAGFLAALLLALDPLSFLYSQMLLSETLFTLSLVLLVCVAAVLLREKTPNAILPIALGICLSFSALVRPIAYYLLAPALLGILLWTKKSRRPWTVVLAQMGLVTLPWLLAVGGWQARNKIATGHAVFSTIQDYNLLFYRGAGIVARRDGISLEDAQAKLTAELADKNVEYPSELYRSRGLALIRDYPSFFLQNEAAGGLRMLAGPAGGRIRKYFGIESDGGGPMEGLRHLSIREWIRKWLGQHPLQFSLLIFEAAFMILLWGGILASLPRIARDRENWPLHFVLIGLCLYILILSAGPESYARFRAPLMPFFAVYATLGIESIWKQFHGMNA